MTDLDQTPADTLPSAVAEDQPEATRPKPSSQLVFAIDCDRTLTGPDLVPAREALDAVARLRAAGIRCILVTGRTQEHLALYPEVVQAFDSFVLEGGASWGPWDSQWTPGNANTVHDAALRVQAQGIAIERGRASFSCDRKDLVRASTLASDCSLQVNLDRVDVLPPGIDKGVGLDGALSRMGFRGAMIIAIGDGENDVPLFHRANVGLAVANAVPALKEEADEVLAGEGPKGLVEAAARIMHGEWAFQGGKG